MEAPRIEPGRGKLVYDKARRTIVAQPKGLKLGYADPPYPGCADLYRDHPDYAGEVDHVALVERLESEFAGWVLHTSATPEAIALLAPLVLKTGARWCSWPRA